MDTDKFKSILAIGETSSIEFKRCGNEAGHDVFESICAFLNRFGGDMFLGVCDDGTVCGVPVAAVIRNGDTRSGDYEDLKYIPRPGHADYAAQVKYFLNLPENSSRSKQPMNCAPPLL